MNDNGREARAVRRLTAELAEEPVPELDWDRVERALDAKLADEPPRSRMSVPRVDRMARRRIGAIIGMCAVAAALALLIVTSLTRNPQPSHEAGLLPTVESEMGPAYLVASLTPGAAVTAGETPVRFTLPGVVTWELAPNGRVAVLAMGADGSGAPHEVRLDKGSIACEVVPVARRAEGEVVESFVVVAGDTRVAVRGTSFTVTRDPHGPAGEQVLVEVRHGSVAVGPVSDAATHELLIGPSRGVFSLAGKKLDTVATAEPAATTNDGSERGRPEDGQPGAEREETSQDDGAPSHVPPPTATTGTPAAGFGPSSGPGVPTPPQPATSDTAKKPAGDERPLGAAEVRSAIARCAGTPVSEAVDASVIVHSTITVYVDAATNRIVSVKFAHGSKEPVRQCALQVIGKSVEGTGTFSFEISFVPHR